MMIAFKGPKTTANFVAYITARLIEDELVARLHGHNQPLTIAEGEQVIRDSIKGAIGTWQGR